MLSFQQVKIKYPQIEERNLTPSYNPEQKSTSNWLKISNWTPNTETAKRKTQYVLKRHGCRSGLLNGTLVCSAIE